MADKINTMTKYVVSSTLGSGVWHDTTVIAAELVDEINLQVFPLLLGSGARPYPETTDTQPLRLVSSRALGSGVMLQTHTLLTDQT